MGLRRNFPSCRAAGYLSRAAAMGHEHHFLSRLDRVSVPHVELALDLYRDHELLRFLLRGAELPEGAERVAISLDDPRDGPFLVVTREGRFVTCLGEGMRTGDLPILTRAQLDGAIVRFAASRARHEERERIGTGSKAQDLFRRIFRAGDELTVEDFQALAAFQPLLGVPFLKHGIETAREVSNQMEWLLSLLRRTDKPRPNIHPMLRAYWQCFWAIGHLAILGSMGGPQAFERHPQLLVRCARVLTSGTMLHGIVRLTQMGLWSVAKLGKPALGIFKQLYDTAKNYDEMLEAALAMTVLGLRHARLQAEVRKAVSPSPPRGRPELSRHAEKLSARVHQVLDEPEKHVAMQRRVGASFAVQVSVCFAPGSPLRFERAEDVPEDIALRLSVQDTQSYLHDMTRMQYVFVCLPWLARTSPESLYLPAEMVQAFRRPWKPERTMALFRGLMEVNAPQAPPRPEGPSRQGPCPCGSGKKYKRCCGKAG